MGERSMELRYDSEADALYIRLSALRDGEVADRIHPIDSDTLVDVAEDGRVLGIEVLSPSRHWPLDLILERFPISDDDATTLRLVFGSRTVA
jgi:uncharacterized protein YuzE